MKCLLGGIFLFLTGIPSFSQSVNDAVDLGLSVKCSYWGGTKSFIRNAHTLLASVDEDNNRNWIRCWGDYRPMGRLVRPVIDRQ